MQLKSTLTKIYLCTYLGTHLSAWKEAVGCEITGKVGATMTVLCCRELSQSQLRDLLSFPLH